MLGLNWSMHERAIEEPCAWAIANDMEGRLELAAGVPEAEAMGVKLGVGNGPRRGGSGLGSKKHGTWYRLGVGVLS
jgi:hypothetical protein